MDRKTAFKDNYMTFSILFVLFAVFVVEIALGGSHSTAVLMKMGAMFNPVIVIKGQWWRLFTAQFLHIGLMHIVSNAIMVYYIGHYMEEILGHFRFLFVYLVSGVGGNLLSLAFGSDQAIGAGASTALFGLFGAMITVGLNNRTNPVISYLGKQALTLAVINLVLDLFDPNIDLQGHLGGLIVGFLVVFIFGDRTGKKYNPKWRVLAGAGLIFYCCVTLRLGMVISF